MLYVQVDCAGVSLLMTGSPHTSMPIATHPFKPRPPWSGFFYVQDYVQDERYIAGEHMDKVRPRSGREGALGYVRRDCVNFARHSATCLAAKVVWSTVSGHAVNPSMGARARPPVSHGPETVDHTPSALWIFIQQWILPTVSD
jgi:hypothetical protein